MVPEVAARPFRTALDSMAGFGVRVEEVSVPEVAHRTGTVTAILYSEASTIHERWLRPDHKAYGADVLERLRHGQRLTATQICAASRRRRVLVERFRQLFERIDVLATPTLSILAPTLEEESRGWVARGQLLGFTQLLTFSGDRPSRCRAISQSGLPIGLQLVGRQFLRKPHCCGLRTRTSSGQAGTGVGRPSRSVGPWRRGRRCSRGVRRGLAHAWPLDAQLSRYHSRSETTALGSIDAWDSKAKSPPVTGSRPGLWRRHGAAAGEGWREKVVVTARRRAAAEDGFLIETAGGDVLAIPCDTAWPTKSRRCSRRCWRPGAPWTSW